MTIQGIWLPLVTPFRDGALDEASLRRMVRHYLAQPVDGFILAATTGEGLTIDEEETERLVAIVAADIGGKRPVYLGISGSDTRKMAKTLARTAAWPVDGTLIACPYYTRPSQEGIYRHFAALAGAAGRPILVYNIPYRTGVNMSNDTLLRLAELPNIAGVKDCCADQQQSFDLIRAKPPEFSVMTGEDALFYAALTQGAEGGILASAHIDTARFASVRNIFVSGDQPGALRAWRALADLPRLLFAEPSPAPIKHWLWRLGLIDSPEVRLPMTQISDVLAARIDREVERSRMAA
jgi:4-hydroxy-tetrahydrodipicolinate synthase